MLLLIMETYMCGSSSVNLTMFMLQVLYARAMINVPKRYVHMHTL